MRRIIRAFMAYLRAHVSVMLHYRGEILLWSMWGIINPAVLYAMWSSAAAGSDKGTIAGLDARGIAAYYFGIMIVGHLTASWDVHQMGYNIRSGNLSPLLLRPLLPLWKSLSENVAYKVTTLVFVVPMWGLFAWLVQPRFDAAAWQLALGLVALAMAAALNFILSYTVSLIAFWATKLDAMGEIYFGLGMFLGGRLAPLDALPAPLLMVAKVLPFRWIFAFPTELLMGKTPGVTEALTGIAIQIIWFGSVVIVFRFFWEAAVKRYTAVSG